MKTRVLIPELMDDPSIVREDHVLALRGLRRINQFSRNASLAWHPVRDLAHHLGRDELRVLDVATGGADIPIELWRTAKANGLSLTIDACDISLQAIECAMHNRSRARAPLNLLTLDILSDEITERYDIVMCSQFLHHLTNAQARFVVRKMANASTSRVVVIDLVRTRLNWLQVWFATRLLSRSPIVHFDGPQSVRAAYTIAEMREIAGSAGFMNFDVFSRWPCRFVLVGDVNVY